MPNTLILRYLSYYNQCIIPQTGVQGNGNTLGRFTKCALGGWFSIHDKPGIKKFAEFSKKGLLFARRYDIIIKLIAAQTEYGRLAQLVEHLLDVQEVTGSSPVPRTIENTVDSLKSTVFSFVSTHFRTHLPIFFASRAPNPYTRPVLFLLAHP